MKNKLRRIVVNELTYFYIVTDIYHAGSYTSTIWLKVFLENYKKTPLIIEFHTKDDYYLGPVLKSGVKLMNHITNIEEVVIMNRPKYIRAMIILGWENGWNGTNKTEIQNGLTYLQQLGYEIGVLLPKTHKS